MERLDDGPLFGGCPRSRLGLASLCVYASDFFEAARNATSLRDADFSPARLYLLCHALELALKAYLSLRGKSGEGLGAIVPRHDLRSLLAQADASGLGDLVRFTAHQRAQVHKAALYYSESVFEYPALAEALRGHPQTPDVEALLGVLAPLVSAVRQASGAVI